LREQRARATCNCPSAGGSPCEAPGQGGGRPLVHGPRHPPESKPLAHATIFSDFPLTSASHPYTIHMNQRDCRDGALSHPKARHRKDACATSSHKTPTRDHARAVGASLPASIRLARRPHGSFFCFELAINPFTQLAIARAPGHVLDPGERAPMTTNLYPVARDIILRARAAAQVESCQGDRRTPRGVSLEKGTYVAKNTFRDIIASRQNACAHVLQRKSVRANTISLQRAAQLSPAGTYVAKKRDSRQNLSRQNSFPTPPERRGSTQQRELLELFEPLTQLAAARCATVCVLREQFPKIPRTTSRALGGVVVLRTFRHGGRSRDTFAAPQSLSSLFSSPP